MALVEAGVEEGQEEADGQAEGGEQDDSVVEAAESEDTEGEDTRVGEDGSSESVSEVYVQNDMEVEELGKL